MAQLSYWFIIATYSTTIAKNCENVVQPKLQASKSQTCDLWGKGSNPILGPHVQVAPVLAGHVKYQSSQKVANWKHITNHHGHDDHHRRRGRRRRHWHHSQNLMFAVNKMFAIP